MRGFTPLSCWFGSWNIGDTLQTVEADPSLVDHRGKFRFGNPYPDSVTGNVLDFKRGPTKPLLTRETRYGSSGGIEDDPWELRSIPVPKDGMTYNRSSAAADSMTLTVEQPLYERQINIRLTGRTFHQDQSCDVYRLEETGGESKLATITLARANPLSSECRGNFSGGNELPHGTTLKIVYWSSALRLPISTWITMVYH